MSRKHIEIHPTIVNDPKVELKAEKQLGKIGMVITLMLLGSLIATLVYACGVQMKLDRYLGVAGSRDRFLDCSRIDLTPTNTREYALVMRGFEWGYAPYTLKLVNGETPTNDLMEYHNYIAALLTTTLITEAPILRKLPVWSYYNEKVIQR